jgi:hypothetical protein
MSSTVPLSWSTALQNETTHDPTDAPRPMPVALFNNRKDIYAPAGYSSPRIESEETARKSASGKGKMRVSRAQISTLPVELVLLILGNVS